MKSPLHDTHEVRTRGEDFTNSVPSHTVNQTDFQQQCVVNHCPFCGIAHESA